MDELTPQLMRWLLCVQALDSRLEVGIYLNDEGVIPRYRWSVRREGMSVRGDWDTSYAHAFFDMLSKLEAVEDVRFESSKLFARLEALRGEAGG